jgi:hypothetical protein
MINIAQLGFTEGIRVIQEISADSTQISSIQREPILQKPYDYNLLKIKLRNFLHNK